MSESGHPAIPAAAVRSGYQVGYVVTVDGKEIFSRGEVFGFRRVAHEKVEITLMHSKTGALFINVLAANTPVALTALAFAPDADTVTKYLVTQLDGLIKQQVSDFFTIMPIED